MVDEPDLPTITLAGVTVYDARQWFPYKGDSGAVVFRPRTREQVDETAIHHDAVAFSGADLNFNGSTVDEERGRMQASYNWHTKYWPGASSARGDGWNWPGLGYHLYTFPSGRIYLVGELGTIRAHVAYRNTRSGGIVGAGDHTHARPQSGLVIAMARAAAFFWAWRGKELALAGHRTWAEQNPVEVRSAWLTSCPGNTYRQWIGNVRTFAKAIYDQQEEEDDMYARIIKIEGDTPPTNTYLWRPGQNRLHMKSRKQREETAALYGISKDAEPVSKGTLDAL